MPENTSTNRLPLTAGQRGIWFGQQLAPANPAYNTADLVEIHGRLDVAALSAAIRQCVAEAESLRTVFGTDEQPWQQIVDQPGWEPLLPDLSDEDDRRAAAHRWMRADLADPVDLGTGPLFTQAVFAIGPEEHWWYQRIHHIAADGFAAGMLQRRVADLYTERIGGPGAGAPLAPLRAVTDADLAYQDSAQRAEDRQFWLDYLAAQPGPGAGAAPRGGLDVRVPRRLTAEIPGDTTAGLRAAAVRLDRSWPELTIAAVALLAHEQGAEPAVTLGLPVSARLGTAAIRVPTTAMNIVPLRVAIPAGSSLSSVSAEVRRQLNRSRDHQRYRHEDLRRDLRQFPGAGAVFGTVVNVLPFGGRLRFGDLRAEVRNLSAGPVEELSLAVREHATGLRLEIDADPERYTEADLAGLENRLLDLLARSAAEPTAPMTRAAAGLDGGAAARPVPVAATIVEHARLRPGTEAVRDGDRSVTYAELHERALAVATDLAACGVRPGGIVGVPLPRGVDAVVAFLGTWLSGCAYLPLDPGAPAARLAATLRDAAPAALIVDADAPAGAAGHRAPQIRIGANPVRGNASGAVPEPGDLAYVVYTSGSTGTPKGVLIEHGALAAFAGAAGERYGITDQDRVLQFAPLHFDASIEEIYLTLCAGATLVIRPPEGVESIAGFLKFCDDNEITVLDLPTAYWHELAYAVCTGSAELPRSVRMVIIGGEAASAEWVRRWTKQVDPSVRLINSYGPTETTVVVTTAVLGAPAGQSGRSAGVRG